MSIADSAQAGNFDVLLYTVDIKYSMSQMINYRYTRLGITIPNLERDLN